MQVYKSIETVDPIEEIVVFKFLHGWAENPTYYSTIMKPCETSLNGIPGMHA